MPQLLYFLNVDKSTELPTVESQSSESPPEISQVIPKWKIIISIIIIINIPLFDRVLIFVHWTYTHALRPALGRAPIQKNLFGLNPQ